MAKFDENALKVPAKIVNLFSVLWGDNNVRIMFADQAAPNMPEAYHTHIMIGHADVKRLVELLQSLEVQHEAKTATKQ